jgi:uncharacterized membrane protein YjgN (DUF898 family)
MPVKSLMTLLVVMAALLCFFAITFTTAATRDAVPTSYGSTPNNSFSSCLKTTAILVLVVAAIIIRLVGIGCIDFWGDGSGTCLAKFE